MSATSTDPELTDEEREANDQPDVELPSDDEPKDEPETDEPGEEEAIAAAVLSEKEIEKRNRALDREAERHAARVQAILGDDAATLVRCEACPPGIAGFHYPPEDYPPGSPDRVLYELLAEGSDAQMRHPDYLETCDECNGFGRVLTGARTELTRFLPCPKCKSAGYVDSREDKPLALTVVTTGDTPAPVTSTPEAPGPEADMWGRPLGHRNFGRYPIRLSPEELASDLAEGFTVGV